jgi:serine/threonine protein kinase
MYVGRYLFQLVDEKKNWTRDEGYLAQMMLITQATKFPRSLLQRSENADNFFNQDGIIPFSCSISYEGTLIRLKECDEVALEDIILYMNPELDENEVRKFGSFIGAVMIIDPQLRPTAAELLEHPWIKQTD